MMYLVNDVRFVEGLDSRYTKVTFKDDNGKNRVVLFDRKTNEIYDYMIERTGLTYYKNLISMELPPEIYYGKMSLYLLTEQDIKEFIATYNTDEFEKFNDLYKFYNANKDTIINVINELILQCELAID